MARFLENAVTRSSYLMGEWKPRKPFFHVVGYFNASVNGENLHNMCKLRRNTGTQFTVEAPMAILKDVFTAHVGWQ
jgi:hypothetical protein